MCGAGWRLGQLPTRSILEDQSNPKAAFLTEHAEDLERDDDGNVIEEVLMDEPPAGGGSNARASEPIERAPMSHKHARGDDHDGRSTTGRCMGAMTPQFSLL